MKVDAKLAEPVPLTHKFAKQNRVIIFCNENTGSTPLDPKLTVLYCTKVDTKLAELVPLTHKFANEDTSENFKMNAPDPLNLTKNSCFGAFRTVSLVHECRCKTGRNGNINAQVR
jgi:hypothetical protein